MVKFSLSAIFANVYNKGKNSEHQYIPLGIIGVVSFIAYYLIWQNMAPADYENVYLRVIGGLLCLILTMKNYWPKVLKNVLPYYWFIVLTYCFPFFFGFMMFKNPDSNIWVMTMMTGIFFLMLLVDWVMFAFILILGLCLAWFAYVSSTEVIAAPMLFWQTIPTYLTVIVAGGIFIFRSDSVNKEKLKTMRSLSAAIAHELRTPLAAIELGANRLKKHLPGVFNGEELSKPQKSLILDTPNQIIGETRSSFHFIDMLIMNLTSSRSIGDLEKFYIGDCINDAISRYPFKVDQRELLRVDLTNNFEVTASKTFLIHVLFNLLKNSLYFVAAAGKGDIFIWLEKTERYNSVCFKDTGAGINPEVYPRIFDSFFSSQTNHGTGIGLAFCKNVMKELGGDIKCESIFGEFTLFKLNFPIS